MKRWGLVLIALLIGSAGAAQAQDPPTPPVTPPPVTEQQPPVTPPPTTPPAEPSPVPVTTSPAPGVPPRVSLSEEELLRRRNAIFVMEGVFVRSVRLAASATQSEIEAAQPDLKVTLFTSMPPEAHGNYLEDYGVFFQVLIPTYQPSVVSILNMLPPNQALPNPAQPAAAARALPLNPDAVYVDSVRHHLTDVMLDYGKALDLKPDEWLTVAARGEDGAPGPVSEPSTMVLRIRGGDLIDFLAGRLTREEVRRRVQVRGYSGRR